MTIEQKDNLALKIIPNPHKEKIAQEREKAIIDLINKNAKKVNELLKVSITNLGGDSTVTGSSTLIEVTRKGEGKSTPHSVLIDLGMFQGTGNDLEKNLALPFDRSKIEAVILTHAHLDHIGRVPMLEKESYYIKKPSGELVKSSSPFNGLIYTSHTGKGLAEIMLADSAKVMAKEGEEKMKMIKGKKENITDIIKQLEKLKNFKNIRFGKKGRVDKNSQRLNLKEHIEEEISRMEEERSKYRGINIRNIDKVFKDFSKSVEDKILYTINEVEAVKSKIKGTGFYKGKLIPYLKGQKNNTGINFVLHGAEHIFGSSIVSVFVDDGKGGTINLGFSGDLGRLAEPYNLIEPDIPPFEYDTFMIESTYGGRNHPGRLEEKNQIVNAMNRVFSRGGKIVIPAFMLQRHQDVSSFIVKIQEEGLIPKDIKIYYDGGSIQSINNIYKANDKDKVYGKLFNSENFIFAGNNKDPKKNEFLNSKVPSIIIAPSGMINGGTIMKYIGILENPRNACMLFGYQGSGTIGRRILEASGNGIKTIHVPEVSDIENFSGAYLNIAKNENFFQWKSFSTHGDQHDLLYFLSELKFKPNATILINHGDLEGGQVALAEALKNQSFLRKDINIVLTQTGGRLSNINSFTNGWQYKVNTIIKQSKKSQKQKNILPISNVLKKEKSDEPLKGVFDRDLFRKMWGKISPSGSFILNDTQVDDILFAIYEKKIDKIDMVLGFIAGLIVNSENEEVQAFLQNPFMKKEEKNIDQDKEYYINSKEEQILEEQELMKNIFTKKRKPKEGKNFKNDFKKEEFAIIVKRKGKKLYSAEIFLRSGKNPEKKVNTITGMDLDSLKTQLIDLGYIFPYTILMVKGCILIDASKVSAGMFINKTGKDNIIEIDIKSSGDFIAGGIYYNGELIKTVRGSTKKAVSRELRKILLIPEGIDLKNRTKGKKIEIILNEGGLSIIKKILAKNSLQKPENIIEVKIITGKKKVEGLIYYKGNIIKQVFGNSKTDVSTLLRESGLIPTKTQLIDKNGKIIKITLNETTFAILKELLKNISKEMLEKDSSGDIYLKEGENNIKKIISVYRENNGPKNLVNKKQTPKNKNKLQLINKSAKKEKLNIIRPKTRKLPKKDKSNKLSRKEKIRLGINKKIKKKADENKKLLSIKKDWPRQIDFLKAKKEELKKPVQVKELSTEDLKKLNSKFLYLREKLKWHISDIQKIKDNKLKNKLLDEFNLILESIDDYKEDRDYLDKIKNRTRSFVNRLYNVITKNPIPKKREIIDSSKNTKLIISNKGKKCTITHNGKIIELTAKNKDKLLTKIRTKLGLSQKVLINNGTNEIDLDENILEELFN